MNQKENIEVLLQEDEKELVKELRKLNYDVDSVWDLVNNSPHELLERRFTGSYTYAYPLLVQHLNIKHHPRTREGIIRALTEKDAKEVAGQALLELFYKEEDDSVKWVIANALKTILPLRYRKKHPEIKEILGF